VDDDLAAVRIDSGRVAPEDHRQLVLTQPDASQRPQVVVVERRGLDRDGDPAVRRSGLRPVADLQAGQRVVAGDAGGVGGKHD
jgi:hypothetical protein